MLCVTLTLFIKWYKVDGIPDRRLKKIPFPQHQQNYVNTLTWIVNIKSNETIDGGFIDKFAREMNLKLIRKFRDLDDHFVFAHINSDNRNFTVSREEINNIIEDVEEGLQANPLVNWFSHQKIVSRQKRQWMPFADPEYRRQWHLTNTIFVGMDTNVTGVWKRNITGDGVTVAIVDDGVEWNNPDLQDNYIAEGSWDFNGDDADPMPDGSKESNHHGTRCAGEVAAVPNNVCAVGVAYGAKVSGLRILDGPMTDSLEAEAFTKFFHINDIYSCSWGPDDDGMTVDGPHFLAAAAMEHGIDFGRHGYGSIYVVASGNGGVAADNCNYDGYANSIYTVTIGAVDETGHMPFYAEECASMLAVTFSNGGFNTRDIVTTDWTANLERSRTGCTEHHTGTSAAAPIAAGLIALMLQVQPCLTWRDVQYLIILTALKVDIDVAHWQRNGAGLWHSHKHGFGLMNAWRLANAARVWNQVPWLTSFAHSEEDVNLPIPKGMMDPLKVSYTVTEQETNRFDLYILETVQVTLTIDHPCRGELEIKLRSPHGTMSVLGASRPKDKSSMGFDHWTFSTVRCWGENPVGVWTLIISDSDYAGMYKNGVLNSWELKLYGTPMSQSQLKQRIRTIREAMDGKLLNSKSVCFPLHVTAPPDANMSVKTLKVLALFGVFLLLFGVYETLESLLCYDKEKEEHSKLEKLTYRAHLLAGKLLKRTRSAERSSLLTEEIPMQTFRSNRDSETPFQSPNNPDLERSGRGQDGSSENEGRRASNSLLGKLRDVIHYHTENTSNSKNKTRSNRMTNNGKPNGAYKRSDSHNEHLVSDRYSPIEDIDASQERVIYQRKPLAACKDETRKSNGTLHKGGYTLVPEDSDKE